jgi:hypothetical protein
MKHAGEKTLQALAPLLEALRTMPGLKERSPGCFYHGSRALLHFHEDVSGLFADLKEGGEWQRFRVSDATRRERLVARVRKATESTSAGPTARPSNRRT